jgi:hypothetical protein
VKPTTRPLPGALACCSGRASIFFSIITVQAIRRGSYRSVKDLIAAIGTFIDAWNERCQPFTWTETAGEIIPEATGGQRTSFTRH